MTNPNGFHLQCANRTPNASLDDRNTPANDAARRTPSSAKKRSRPRRLAMLPALPSSLPPPTSPPCRHYLLALSTAVLSAVGFACALASGLSCSFLSVTYATSDNYDIDGEWHASSKGYRNEADVLTEDSSGWYSDPGPEGNEDSNGWYTDPGPDGYESGTPATTVDSAGIFCNNDDRYGGANGGSGTRETLSKAFLSLSLSLGAFLLLLTIAISTPILPDITSKLWNGISALSILTFVVQLPTLLILDGGICADYAKNECTLSTGSIPLFVSMVSYVLLSILVQWKDRPDWKEEYELWNLVQRSSSSGRRRPGNVERDRTEEFDYDEENGLGGGGATGGERGHVVASSHPMAGEETYAVLGDRRPTTMPGSGPPKVKKATRSNIEKMNLLSHDDLISSNTDTNFILNELNTSHEESERRISRRLREERKSPHFHVPLDELRRKAAASSKSSDKRPPVEYISIEDRSITSEATTAVATGASSPLSKKPLESDDDAPATPPRNDGNAAGIVGKTGRNVSPLSHGSNGARPPACDVEAAGGRSPVPNYLGMEDGVGGAEDAILDVRRRPGSTGAPVATRAERRQDSTVATSAAAAAAAITTSSPIATRAEIRRRVLTEAVNTERTKDMDKKDEENNVFRDATNDLRNASSVFQKSFQPEERESDIEMRTIPSNPIDSETVNADVGTNEVDEDEIGANNVFRDAADATNDIVNTSSAFQKAFLHEGRMNADTEIRTIPPNPKDSEPFNAETNKNEIDSPQKDAATLFQQPFPDFDGFDASNANDFSNDSCVLFGDTNPAFGDGDDVVFGNDVFSNDEFGNTGDNDAAAVLFSDDVFDKQEDVVVAEGDNHKVGRKIHDDIHHASGNGESGWIVNDYTAVESKVSNYGSSLQKEQGKRDVRNSSYDEKDANRHVHEKTKEERSVLSQQASTPSHATEKVDVATSEKAAEGSNKFYDKKGENHDAHDGGLPQNAKMEQQELSQPQTYSTKEAAAYQHFDDVSVDSSSAVSNQSNTPSSKRRLKLKMPSRPHSVLPSSQSFSSASTNLTSNKSGSGTASSGRRRGLKKHGSIFRRKSKNDVVHVVLNDEDDDNGNNSTTTPKKNASPSKTKGDGAVGSRIVSPEKHHDPDINVYPSENDLSELSLTDNDYLTSDGDAPAIRSVQSMGNYSSDGSFYTNDSNMTDSELSAVIDGVNKQLQHRVTSGKITPFNKRRRRRRKGRRYYSAASSVNSSLSGYSSHGSLLDEVIVEEGELNSSNEVANTSGCEVQAVAALSSPARKKSVGSVPVLIEASPKRKHKDRSKSRSGSKKGSGNSIVDVIEASPKRKHKDPSKSRGGSRKGSVKSNKVVPSDEGGSGYGSAVVDAIISDADESFSSLAARARRNRIAKQPSFSRPMSPDFPDDEASGFMVADKRIDNRSPPLTAGEMMVDDSASDTNSHTDTVAWRARKVRMARLRMVRQSVTVANTNSNDYDAASPITTYVKLGTEEEIIRATHDGVYSDESSI
mmetsp:Transcript_14402/g.26013  ORF Transcript_14402/g.26013 Transcript_14402/m.26013 type:complete len:1499 (-) Transcript_14402:116-4612(-)|eukprot:CAMPEP_0201652674 /NCGR_PEP_ID=MMETSP0493-20130528/44599_1 /ASSEMBLY_ACC=CAM_ASM_000838 /TAXON_ID=420259 /ORGANISM="Thalassiosira gravida, Strain GMp14c1" /LENGTH=1498 /DNA_ID=CAMNT_0048129199 /DNA_START=174 /DNA_END=4670 /DNA_ORIENTATION=-